MKLTMDQSYQRLKRSTKRALRMMASCAGTGHPPDYWNRNAMRWWKKWMVKGME